MRVILVLLCCAATAHAQQPATAVPASIRGFPRDMVAGQAQHEALLKAVPRADSLRARMELLAAVPHEAGTPRSRAVAERVLARFRAAGLDARIEQFEALMPRPVSRTVEMVAPEHWTASLKEPAIPQDPTSGQPDQLPTFNAYSPDGDVTGDLVYVNYGLPEDYRVLDSLGISVRGKIVIARYLHSWRGIKPKVAAEHGALACILYSDPRDDGYFEGDVYPNGPLRPWDGVQRGSVMDMPTYPGDPLSPGWGSVAGSRRLPREEATTIAKIPVLPISYAEALPLLKQLRGPVAPEAWRGALPLTYHVGPGPAVVRVALAFDWQTRPLYDVIVRIPGALYPDQWVIYGNHHDAWVNGGNDPISGLVALEETARALGALLKTGWRPARTIVLAAWDGEEWGLLGSTEWAEQHAAELADKAVVYYNSDTNGNGWIGASGSHSLEAFLGEVARDVTDPAGGGTALAATLAHRRSQKASDSTWSIGALGSGSDYSTFIDHLSVPSADIRFGGGSNDNGTYHSIYDTYTYYERFLDTAFVYGVAEAQTMATAIVRMADAPVLPFEFGAVARTYGRYLNEIDSVAKSKGATAGALDLTAPRAAVAALDSASRRYETVLSRLAGMPSSGLTSASRRAALAQVNALLYRSEHALADTAGLPRRPWYRHLIYAPGYYTGYGVKTMPGIREEIEQGRTTSAQSEAARVAAAVARYTAQVNRATAALDAALR